MNKFECVICYQIFNNPIECIRCNNNFCKKHLPILNNKCPFCNNCPFRYIENIWLRRIILGMGSCECALCGFEGDEKSF